MSSPTPDADTLRSIVATILVAAGASLDAAGCVADALIESDMTGHASHGIRMLPLYVERLRSGVVDGRAVPAITVDHGAIVRVDANRAFGQVAGTFAGHLGVARAKAHGIALITVSNSGHFGRNGKWPEIAAQAGIASLHFGKGRNGAPVIAPFGGTSPRLFSSPIALGAPGASQHDGPIILDFAVSETSINEVRRAAELGLTLPSPCIVTPDGQYSTDPNILLDVTRAAAITCFGGFKGYGLALFAELFAGILATDGIEDGRPENSMLSIYFDVDKLMDRAAYAAAVATLAHAIRTCPPVDDGAPVAVPGDRATARKGMATVAGVIGGAGVRAALDRAAELAGLTLPLGL